MKEQFYIQSPCKINLSLLVHKQRDDGYHELTSIFQMISLYDTISIIKNGTNKISLAGYFDCAPEQNLIYKATELFKQKTGIDDGFIIEVEKHIPAGGGIGGGSGNCASTLRLLNYIYNDILSEDELFDIGLSLGSDVPFFFKAPTAMVEGRGELITPISTMSDYYILLVNPGIHISTAKAFNQLKEINAYEPKSPSLATEQISIYYKGVNYFSFFKNSFEFALHSDYTFISSVEETMISEGALFAALSGSGSTMFGIFKSRKQAESAINSFSQNKHYKIFLVEPLTELPKIKKRRV